MIINASGDITKNIFEQGLKDLSHIPFTLHVECKPTPEQMKLNPTNIYYHSEPNEYFGNHSWVFNRRDGFDAILTWNNTFIQAFPNAVKTLFGTCTLYDNIGKDWLPKEKVTKTPVVSFLRGNKKHNVVGHQMRWDLWNLQDNVIQNKNFLPCTSDTYAQTVEEEYEWHKPRTELINNYTHHICIENTMHKNYFTEKIIDCFALKTIPVYIGCPNITEWFSPKGMIIAENVPELIFLLNSIDLESHYNNNLDAIEDNYERSKQFWCWTTNVKRELEKLF